jgi:signal transduction histidine kinase
MASSDYYGAVTISFRGKLLASHAAVALVVGLVTLVVVDRQVSRSMEHQIDQRLEAQARAVATWMERAAHPAHLARRLAGVVDARVTILDRHGIAVGESHARANAKPAMDSEGEPPEVVAARDGKLGRETRFNAVEDQLVRYVAVPGPQDVVVRLGLPLGEIDDTKSQLRGQLIVGAIASVLVALGLAALVAGPLTRRLREATAVAKRIGAGDYAVQASSNARDEIGVLSRALAAAGAELAATERKRREFLANVAHEIRTPVTSICGYAQILSGEKIGDDDTRREFVQTIQRNAVRIGTLVEDLLELEALEAGRGPPLARDEVALGPLVKHVVDTLRARADELGASLDVDVPANLVARGDSDAVERIVLNLVDNALRYGGRDVEVRIAARRTDGRVRISVTDTGPGVPDEHRSKIFERFNRGSQTQEQGSGLGLAIARELAAAMGGSLRLESSSTFTLELPA